MHRGALAREVLLRLALHLIKVKPRRSAQLLAEHLFNEDHALLRWLYNNNHD